MQKIVGESASNYWSDDDGALQPKTTVINELAYNTLKKKFNDKSNFDDEGVPFCPNYVNDVVIANTDPTRTTVAALLEFKKGLFCNGRKLTTDDKYNVKDGNDIISANGVSYFKSLCAIAWNNTMNKAIDEIQKKVSSYFNIKLEDLISSRRIRTFARPRQIAMYLSKKLTSRSLPEIGRKFGGRDHTTVIHAVKKIDELKENDSKFDEDVNLITQMITSL